MTSWWHRDITLGDKGRDVAVAQRILGVPATGIFDERFETMVRGKQKAAKLPTTGKVDKETANAIGERATAGMTPDWYLREFDVMDTGEDCKVVNDLLDLASEGNLYSPNSEAAVRRLQSEHGLPTNGRVDETLAVILGDA